MALWKVGKKQKNAVYKMCEEKSPKAKTLMNLCEM